MAQRAPLSPNLNMKKYKSVCNLGFLFIVMFNNTYNVAFIIYMKITKYCDIRRCISWQFPSLLYCFIIIQKTYRWILDQWIQWASLVKLWHFVVKLPETPYLIITNGISLLKILIFGLCINCFKLLKLKYKELLHNAFTWYCHDILL